MDAQTNALVKSLIHMMWADGVIEEHEREFLGGVVSELGCTEEEMNEISKMMVAPPTEELNFDVDSIEQSKREEILQAAAAMAMVDGVLAGSEKKMVEALADHLDIPTDRRQALIEEVRQGVTSVRSLREE
ncbi:TPA: hypothetical protein DD394_03210 [bacterium UBP9_UBA11836]|nr:hypothetical protein [bacterium UBP9_UBA11836]